MPDVRTGHRATLIESLGVYLPPREVPTTEVMRGCVQKRSFPLERMSGIKSRHVAGDTEFSIDLAERAITRCLAFSRHAPGDVEILISTAVSRVDGPSLCISHEPSTALRLRQRCGLDRALTFDVASACSGMFIGIAIVDTLIQRGAIDRGMVVSGEYISHLALTAQKEIAGLLDPRLACLTLGDAGAAVMLEATEEARHGFDALDLVTFGAYAEYCMAFPTTEPHGGAIMYTDALKLTETATRTGVAHALRTLERAGWSPDAFDHLIMHQTSRTALSSAMREINRVVKKRISHSGNTVDNLARRGNTASTTHFVAIADQIAKGAIRSGDRALFAISGSGMTVGTGLYVFDDLPDRLAAPPGSARPRPVAESPSGRDHRDAALIRIESIGTAPAPPDGRAETLRLLREAASECLARSRFHRRDLDLLIYAGVYRTAYVCEPAIATLLAGELDINATMSTEDDRRTLAFDIGNGAVGLLNACHIAAEMIRAGKATAAMVVAAEIENNADAFPSELVGIEETGSAMVLTAGSGATSSGFGPFFFRAFPEHIEAFTSRVINRNATTYLAVARSPDLERGYTDAIIATVREFLEREGLTIGEIAQILPPQISTEFIAGLSRAMGVPWNRFVDATRGRRNLFTSSVPFAFRAVIEGRLARPREIGLVITVGSGVEVGCALYYF